MPEQTYFSNKGKKYIIKDSDEIHRGGEGKIMTIGSSDDIVAKIYHDNIQPISEEQFNFLSKIKNKIFVVPTELLKSEKGKIVGFIMEYISRDFFPISSILNKNFCRQNKINETFKRKTAQKLIDAVDYAHKNKIVAGDFNQYNILINKKGDIRLIDTDSYQTPAHKHSGILLDDIRDFLYGGTVSKNSDFFALSVMLFYSFTYTHPFKGIHKKYKKISDRMVQKIPIFRKDPNLKIPKVYQAVADRK